MAAETGVLLVLTFFQLAGSVFLFRQTGPRRTAYRYLASLLVLNAVLSAYEGLRAEGLTDPNLQWVMRIVDLPSGLLILASAFALLERKWADRAAQGALIAAGLQMVAAVIWPELLSVHYPLFQAIPYYAAIGALCLVGASGREPWKRWVALAFLPRAFYFITPVLVDLLFERGWLTGEDLANQIGMLGLLVVSVIALGLLLVPRGGFSGAVAFSTVIVGPVLAASQVFFIESQPSAVAIHNWLSLGLVRPLFLYVGCARGALPQITARTLVASAVAATAGIGTAAFLAYPPLPSSFIGVVAGLLAFALLDSLAPGLSFQLGGAPAPTVRRTPTAPSPDLVVNEGGASMVVEDSAPHWQRLLLELRGSSRESDDGLASPMWTQKALAHRTGISVKRVSEFPSTLNASAAQKLATHLPDLVIASRDAPLLVETQKGAVRGAAGTWVYYRLTPEGERLADHLAESLLVVSDR